MAAFFGSVLVVLGLLAIGAAIHRRFGIFERVYIPASVIAGFVGLAILQAILHGTEAEPSGGAGLDSAGWLSWLEPIVTTLRAWPGFLIAVVFAAMLLQPPSGKRGGKAVRATACEALMVGVIAVGQTAIGLLLTWLVIQPFHPVPNAFGMLIETGFAGGHGTAAAMGQVFATPGIDFPSGLDLGWLMATAGLVYGTVSGIFWINVVLRFRRSFPVPPCADQSRSVAVKDVKDTVGSESGPARPDSTARMSEGEGESGKAIGVGEGFRGSAADRPWWRAYATQGCWIALAFAIGWLVQGLVAGAAERLDARAVPNRVESVELESGVDVSDRAEPSPLGKKLSYSSLVGGFPLFIYTLLGGLLIARVLVRLGLVRWLDGPAGGRISGMAMDGLVVAAITTLNLDAVATFLVPVTILFLGGAIWSAVCLLVLAPRMLPAGHWFELALINYGMSTGTTATGFVLLRLVDPELRTDAAKHYALAAPISAPLVGGGLVTLGLPLLVLGRVPIAVSASAVTAVVVMILIGLRLNRGG